MPAMLSMERVMVDQLGHKLTPHDTQHGYLKKYLAQSEKHFSQGRHALSVLSKIYGPDSFVVHLARRREIIHEHELGNMTIEKEMHGDIQKSAPPVGAKLPTLKRPFWAQLWRRSPP